MCRPAERPACWQAGFFSVITNPGCKQPGRSGNSKGKSDQTMSSVSRRRFGADATRGRPPHGWLVIAHLIAPAPRAFLEFFPIAPAPFPSAEETRFSPNPGEADYLSCAQKAVEIHANQRACRSRDTPWLCECLLAMIRFGE